MIILWANRKKLSGGTHSGTNNYLQTGFKKCDSQHFGALAQLARAFDWQSRGHRFDSDMLHDQAEKNTPGGVFFYGGR